MTAGRLRVGIVYDDTLDRPGGVGSYCRDLARELGELGHRPELLVGASSITNVGGFPVHALSRNVRVAFNGNVMSIPAVARRRQVRALLAERAYDVLHVQMPYSPLMAGLVIDEAPPSTTIVGTFHVFSESSLVRAGSRVLASGTRRTSRRIQHVLAVSEPARSFARDCMGIEACVLPNMVDVEGIAERLTRVDREVSTPAGEGPHVVFVGNLVRRKGVTHLLDAFATVLDTMPSASLTVAGTGPELQALQRQVERLQIADHVRFLGKVSEQRKYEILRDADVACFPSLFGESFGIVLLEAVASGARAVIAGANAGYISTLGSVAPDVCVDATDRVALAAAITRSFRDSVQGLHDRLADLARDYESCHVTAQILAVYRSAGALGDIDDALADPVASPSGR